MEPMSEIRPKPGGIRPLRVVQVLLRSAHIAAMGLVLGGCWLGMEFEPLKVPIVLTVATGILLFALDLAKGLEILHQGSGLLMLLKLVLLGLGNVFPAHRFGWYLAATLVASFGSHMPASWRHYSIWNGRDLRPRA